MLTDTKIELNLDYVNACKLLLPAYDSITLALIGCGGTGSWLAPSVARVARLLMEKFGKHVRIVFVDPDHVEPKNVYRQNFCQAEVGANKAETLGYRFGLAWGLEIKSITAAFDDSRSVFHGSDLRVLIGCVDNPAARRAIAKVDRGSTWWLDCGNTRSYGQVLLGSRDKVKDPFSLPGCCSWLPLPSAQHPELIESLPAPVEPDDMSGLSCADMAMVDSQGLAINQRMAAEAADYLVRMLITKDLRKYATYIDLESGTVKSKYITEGNIRS